MDQSDSLGFSARWAEMFSRIAAIPFVFLGVGLYRAWLSIFFRYGAFPAVSVSDYFVFESSIGAAAFLLAFFAKPLGALWKRPRMHRASAVAMTAGAVVLFVGTVLIPAEPLKICGLLLSGGGLGVLILIWAEFYGSLNPLRVALYHSLAIFFGECIKWLFMGLSFPYLVFFSIALPPVCVASAYLAMRKLPQRDLNRPEGTMNAKSIPWKPIILMATCTFAAAFGALPTQQLIAGNVSGTLFVTALVFFGVLSASRWFNFDTIYQLAFPLFIVGFLLVVPAFGGNENVRAFCYDAGYTMLSMYIMIVLSNITYRFGVSAVWLNGIERGIRYLVELIGWGAFACTSLYLGEREVDFVYDAIALIVVLAFLVIFFTERGLSAKWGVVLKEPPVNEKNAGHLAMRVSDVSKQFGLTPREDEVLNLLAQRMTVGEIEKALFVSQGTVKAHINHIYRKLSVHSKQELFSLLEEKDGRIDRSGE